MSEIWGRYKPKTGPGWLMALFGKPCKVIILDTPVLIRVYDSSWGIKGGLIISCPVDHVEVIGAVD